MRFVPTSCLREGMITAKSLYDRNGQLLLRLGGGLKHNYISRIAELGYQGVYIEDDLSKDIKIVNLISDELRIKAVQTIKNSFVINSVKNSIENIEQKLSSTQLIVEEIIGEILDNDISMVNMIDLKFFDEYTYYHSVNVCVLSIVIGVALSFSKDKLIKLGLGSILHDIGKVFIDKNILNKKGKLSSEEFKLIQNHSHLGYKYLKRAYNVLPTVYRCVLNHHERYDGKGYPNQVAREKIPLFGRIVTVCDVYDALSSNRPYRKALPPSEAMEYIMANGGRLFDPKIVEVFVKKVAPYPIGTLVKLSNGYIGLVVKNYEECCMRPKIKIIKDANGNEVSDGYLDLKDDLKYANITIIGMGDI